ncbi:hypothetical protein Q5424_09285 [Conexibacter sp. JD483]|uniref:hypothetical protein n=1 Tax=unclassified Conexibacter TaxID=2627773 RepID=UPI00271E6819|nr:MULTISPECIES: hypothetical protein [unclassified Conexibacter]MDO8187231.1 hypothetical protein [Conexibacter sp. CPCC 205706]MDO8199328.1 hypothetical protein [Conexibacter sp. CPCC 205762]MDR9369271.1 hypothetical protein [Conexibacter sp. JD483]
MSDGRTVWWPKDSAWWRREHVVELGEEFGPAGPAVLDWLTCEAKAQNDGGRVKAGLRSCARGAFVEADLVDRVLLRAAALGALDDYVRADGRFTARISGWEQDNERGRAAFRKARQRERDGAVTDRDVSRPVTPGHAEAPTGEDRTGQQETAGAVIAAPAGAGGFDEHVIRLCRLQSELARARTNQASSSRRLLPTRRWHVAMDRLMRLDGWTPEQVEHVIRWVDRHSFWAPNVLTAEALRRHFDRFAAAINAERRGPPPPAGPAAIHDRGAARRARAAAAFAELVRPAPVIEQLEGSESRDVA